MILISIHDLAALFEWLFSHLLPIELHFLPSEKNRSLFGEWRPKIMNGEAFIVLKDQQLNLENPCLTKVFNKPFLEKKLLGKNSKICGENFSGLVASVLGLLYPFS